MTLNLNEVAALCYSDVFSWPLNRGEMKAWQISISGPKKLGSTNLIETKNGYYFLAGHHQLVAKRKQRQEQCRQKILPARKIISQLQNIPLISGIFLTGSVAVGNATKDSDIDLLVITQPHTLWLVRLVVVGWLKLHGLYRKKGHLKNKVCTNIFLDSNHLAVREKNLYSAHEILQARCLYDQGGIAEKWLEKNNWTKDYLPGAYEYQVSSIKHEGKQGAEALIFLILLTQCLAIFNLLAFLGQYLYMKSKITNEKIGWGYAYFHPQDLSSVVLKKYSQKLKKFGFQEG